MAHSKNHSREFSSKTNLKKLMNLFPAKVLSNLVEKYHADRWVTLLYTEKFLRLLIFMRVLKPVGITLRGIVEYSNNLLARSVSRLTKSLSRSGFSDRQNKIPAELFAELYDCLVKIAGRAGKKLSKKIEAVKIFDTTFISLSLKVFKWATSPNPHKGKLGIGVRIDDGQSVPERVIIDFKKPNDNKIFEQMLDFLLKGVTYIFDRGFTAIKVLEKIHLSNNFFITRMYPYKTEIIKNLKFAKTKNTDKFIRVIKDQLVHIGSTEENKSKVAFRMVTVIRKEDNKRMVFLTNRMDLKPIEICQLYKHRWQIELLFKWLKQYLRINKLIARSMNGVLVQIYIALITNLLLLLYRQLHKLNFSLLQILRLIENYTINAFCIFMFQLGARAPCREKLLTKNSLQFLELSCF